MSKPRATRLQHAERLLHDRDYSRAFERQARARRAAANVVTAIEELADRYVAAAVDISASDPERLLHDRAYRQAFEEQKRDVVTEARQRIIQTVRAALHF